MFSYGADLHIFFRVWRIELGLNKKWYFGYETYAKVGGTYLALYLIPCMTVRVALGAR